MTCKTFFLFFFLSVILSAGLWSCGGGDDDDDDDDAQDDDFADDDADDDIGDDDADDDVDDDADDDADDDDQPLDVSDVQVGECQNTFLKSGLPDPTLDPYDVVEIEWRDGVLFIMHLFAVKSCGFEARIEASLSDNGRITVREYNAGDLAGDLAGCVCARDVFYQIENLDPGIYRFRLFDHEDEAKSEGTPLADLELTLDNGTNWKWGVPLVDSFTQPLSSDPYPAQEPIDLSVSPCFLEDKTSVQVSHRLGFGKGYAPDGIFFTVHDRRDIDNPGETEDVCILFAYTLPGLDPGTYTLFANSFDYRETGDWSLLARVNPVIVE